MVANKKPTTHDKSKAKKSKAAAKSGAPKKRTLKVYTVRAFRRPKTLKQTRRPVYIKKSVQKSIALDKYKILRHPLTTESAMKKIEDNNTLVFIVDRRSNKKQIARAVKDMYDIKSSKVNTLIRPDGLKKLLFD